MMVQETKELNTINLATLIISDILLYFLVIFTKS